METVGIRLLAFVGILLPTFVILWADCCDMGFLPTGWRPDFWLAITSFPIGLMAYLPWIYLTLNQRGLWVVVGITIFAFLIQAVFAVVTFVVMFALGGDTI